MQSNKQLARTQHSILFIYVNVARFQHNCIILCSTTIARLLNILLYIQIYVTTNITKFALQLARLPNILLSNYEDFIKIWFTTNKTSKYFALQLANPQHTLLLQLYSKTLKYFTLQLVRSQHVLYS